MDQICHDNNNEDIPRTFLQTWKDVLYLFEIKWKQFGLILIVFYKYTIWRCFLNPRLCMYGGVRGNDVPRRCFVVFVSLAGVRLWPPLYVKIDSLTSKAERVAQWISYFILRNVMFVSLGIHIYLIDIRVRTQLTIKLEFTLPYVWILRSNWEYKSRVERLHREPCPQFMYLFSPSVFDAAVRSSWYSNNSNNVVEFLSASKR